MEKVFPDYKNSVKCLKEEGSPAFESQGGKKKMNNQERRDKGMVYDSGCGESKNRKQLSDGAECSNLYSRTSGSPGHEKFGI